MTVESSAQKFANCGHGLSVKLRAGASLVKVKPLFTPDSRYLLLASGCDIKVFSTSSGECSLTFKSHDTPVVSFHINPDNNLQVLSCSEDGVIIRWDYSDGKALMKYSLHFKNTVSAFYAVPSCKMWFVAVNHDTADFCKFYAVRKYERKDKILSRVYRCENSVAVGVQGKYVAGVYGNALLVHDMIKDIGRRHMTGEVKLNCVACHPSLFVLATGDAIGRIIVWTGMLESNSPIRSMYHWHSLSLPDLVFSPEGSHIYSAGGESVLIKWDLNTGHKETLPRLGLPIHRVAVSPDNKFVATSHVDNSLQIINTHNIVVQVIQGLTQGHCNQVINTFETVPTGLLYDARSKALVLNGRPGHLQFYNLLEDKQLFHLDIVAQNYICQDSDTNIVNTDVTKAAIESMGKWLATVEYRDDGETSLDLRLKFWQFDETSQKFVLNTNIFLPHSQKINSLKFQPKNVGLPKDKSSPMAVTTGCDKRFKIWTLTDGDNVSWSCEQMGYYKDMMPTEMSFSEDGSLLCVVFGCMATLWSSDSISLKTALHYPQSTDCIKQVEFGHKECRHLLVYHTGSLLLVWNVLSLSVLWSVSCNIQYLVCDPLSDIMTVFADDKNLFVFKPSDPRPLTVINNISKEPIIAAIFVPQPQGSRISGSKPCCWQQHSKLYFLNKNQELLTLDNPGNETEADKVVLHPSMPPTPFGLLQAERTVTAVKPHESKQLQLDLNSEQSAEFLCPTHVNPIALCEKVLQNMLLENDASKQVKDAWDSKRCIAKNMENMSLSFDANKSVKHDLNEGIKSRKPVKSNPIKMDIAPSLEEANACQPKARCNILMKH